MESTQSPPSTATSTRASGGLARIPTWALALIVPVIAGVAVLVTVVATDGSSSTTAAPSSKPGTVTIKDFAFSPDPIEVPAGSTVTVVNADGTVHTLTAADGSFDTGDLQGGKTATVTVAKAGTYEYFCEIHQYMTGSLKAS
jgi:plastocyanin